MAWMCSVALFPPSALLGGFCSAGGDEHALCVCAERAGKGTLGCPSFVCSPLTLPVLRSFHWFLEGFSKTHRALVSARPSLSWDARGLVVTAPAGSSAAMGELGFRSSAGHVKIYISPSCFYFKPSESVQTQSLVEPVVSRGRLAVWFGVVPVTLCFAYRIVSAYWEEGFV